MKKILREEIEVFQDNIFRITGLNNISSIMLTCFERCFNFFNFGLLCSLSKYDELGKMLVMWSFLENEQITR